MVFLCAFVCTCELPRNLNEHAVNEATRDREPEEMMVENQQHLANSGHPREGMHRGFIKREWKWVMGKGEVRRELESDKKGQASGDLGPRELLCSPE